MCLKIVALLHSYTFPQEVETIHQDTYDRPDHDLLIHRLYYSTPSAGDDDVRPHPPPLQSIPTQTILTRLYRRYHRPNDHPARSPSRCTPAFPYPAQTLPLTPRCKRTRTGHHDLLPEFHGLPHPFPRSPSSGLYSLTRQRLVHDRRTSPSNSGFHTVHHLCPSDLGGYPRIGYEIAQSRGVRGRTGQGVLGFF